MDSITQGLLGAVAGHAGLGKRLGRRAALLGAMGGVAPDLDIFIRSARDPLLGLELHRHFTHSLAIVPVGGALVGLLGWLLLRRRLDLRWAMAAATLGYASHAPLDLLTSYGTRLLWPFSDARLAWDWVAIVDPLFTLTLVGGLLAAWRLRSARATQAALALGLLYLGFGGVQHARAARVQAAIAAERGVTPERGRVLPTVFNLLLWRSVYIHDGRIHVDAIRVAPLGETRRWPGGSVAQVRPEDLDARIAPETTLGRDLRRFAHFADGYLASTGEPGAELGDLRYAMLPQSLQPLWGIRFDASAPERHVERVNHNRDIADGTWSLFWSMLAGAHESAHEMKPTSLGADAPAPIARQPGHRHEPATTLNPCRTRDRVRHDAPC